MTSKHVQIAVSPDYYTDYFSSAFQGLNDKLKFGNQNRIKVRKESSINYVRTFFKKLTFFTPIPDTRTYLCVSGGGGKKC